jgi:hypothetical protein
MAESRKEYEDQIRLDLQHAFREIGFWDYHPPDDSPAVTDQQIHLLLKILKLAPTWFQTIRNFFIPPKWKRDSVNFKRPDIYGLNPRGPTIVCEAKWIEPKKEIEPWFDPASIRDGQRDWLDVWYSQAHGPTYLGIGTTGHGRRLWAIPWERWNEMERRLAEKVIDFRITISDLEWCGEEYELDFKDKLWRFRNFHPVLALALDESSPNRADWKKPFTLRFGKPKETNDSN